MRLTRQSLALSCALACLLAPLRASSAQDVDPRAVRILQHSDSVLAAANAVTADHFFKSGGYSIKSRMAVQRPNLFRVDLVAVREPKQPGAARDSSVQWVVSDGKLKIDYGYGGRCKTSVPHPRNQDPFSILITNELYRGFFGLADWNLRYPLVGLWSTPQRLADPGLKSLRYVGKQQWEGNPYDVIEWVYKIGFNLPDEDPTYTTMLFVGADGFVHRIVSRSTSGSLTEENIHDVRALSSLPPSTFAHTAADLTGCTPLGGSGSSTDLRVATAAPDFTLYTPDGKRVRLSEAMKGKKAVYLNFWGYT